MEAAITLFETEAPSSAKKAPQKNRFYTYLVTPAGPVIQVADENGETSLSLRARLTRNDGKNTVLPMRIANTAMGFGLIADIGAVVSAAIAVFFLFRADAKAWFGKDDGQVSDQL